MATSLYAHAGAVVSFKQDIYWVNEHSAIVTPVLLLSNPLSRMINVTVLSLSGSASGEQIQSFINNDGLYVQTYTYVNLCRECRL